VTKAAFDEAFPDKPIGEFGGMMPACWPMTSDSMGVAPDQVQEAIADSIRVGVPTHFDSQGRPVLTSPEHRKRYSEAYGFFDKNGGFSDPRRR